MGIMIYQLLQMTLKTQNIIKKTKRLQKGGHYIHFKDTANIYGNKIAHIQNFMLTMQFLHGNPLQ